MSNSTVTPLQKRSQTNSLIAELLEERKQVWSVYCMVAGIEPQKTDESMEELVRKFCQLSVDYISLGHFGVYQRIIDGKERRQSILQVAERTYPLISKATVAVLDFNDKYEKLTPAMILHDLADDLSTVGEHLANRIEWEDELLGEMLA